MSSGMYLDPSVFDGNSSFVSEHSHTYPVPANYQQINGHQRQPIMPIVILASGILLAMGAIFLALATHQVLPSGLNCISQLSGHGGLVLSYGVLGLGVVATIIGSCMRILDCNRQNHAIPIYNPYQGGGGIPIGQPNGEPSNTGGGNIPIGQPNGAPANPTGANEHKERLVNAALQAWVNESSETSRQRVAQQVWNCFQDEQLTALDFTGVSTLPDIFDFIPHIETLRITNCQVRALPPSLLRLKKLKYLKLQTMAEGTQRCVEQICLSPFIAQTLEVLDLENGSLCSMPPQLDLLRNLKTLNISHNSISSLPDDLFRSARLEYINVCSNPLTEEAITSKAESIRAFLKRGGRIVSNETNIQSALNQVLANGADINPADPNTSADTLEHLKNALDAWANEAGIPESEKGRRPMIRQQVLGCFQHQRKALNFVSVSTLPDIFHFIPQIETVKITTSTVRELPPSFLRLTNLKSLKLETSNAATCLDAICSNECMKQSLEVLDLENANLDSLHVGIGDLSNLRSLNLSRNRFQALPNDLFELPKLNQLNASSNQLSLQAIANINQLISNCEFSGRGIVCDLSNNNSAAGAFVKDPYLQQLIDFWEIHARALPNAAHLQFSAYPALHTLSPMHRGNLSAFLNKVQYCADFVRLWTKDAFVLEIHEMLSAMEKKPQFRDQALAYIAYALSGCEDRQATIINSIRALRLLSEAENMEEVELAKLIIGVKRLEVLNLFTEEKAARSGSPHESIEMVLGYQIDLRNILGLPIITQRMGHPNYFERPQAEKAEAARHVFEKTKDFTTVLCSFVQWGAKIEKQNPQVFKDIETQYDCTWDPLEVTEAQYIEKCHAVGIPVEENPFGSNTSMTDWQYEVLSRAQKNARQPAIDRAIKDLTKAWMQEHGDKLASLKSDSADVQ